MIVRGLITTVVASMRDGSTDEGTVRGLVERLTRKGVNGMFILGINGEFHVLSREEKVKLAAMVAGYADCKVPVYTGNGGSSTREAIELSQALQQTGITALSVITSFLVPPSQRELLQHYEAVVDAVNIPIILYSIPKNTGNDIGPQTAAAPACHDNIVGTKNNSGNTEQIKQYIEPTKRMEFVVLNGSDSLILKALKLRVRGAVTTTNNLLTNIDAAIIRYFKQEKLAETQMMQEKIEPLCKALKLGGIPLVLKVVTNMAGIAAGECRKSIIMSNEAVLTEVREILQYYVQEGEM